MISSVNPSLKYSLSFSALILANGNTAIELRKAAGCGILRFSAANEFGVNQHSSLQLLQIVEQFLRRLVTLVFILAHRLCD